MKSKIIAKAKKDKLDLETKDQWMSFEKEELEAFKNRMKEGGSDPNNFDFSDPAPKGEKQPDLTPEIIVAVFEYAKGLVLNELTKTIPTSITKPPIKAGHKDINRSLTDRGKAPIYDDKDETHHDKEKEDKEVDKEHDTIKDDI